MEKKLKFVRMAALLGAVAGASVFFGLGITAASAGEQRLHGEFSANYGLIPLMASSGSETVTSPKSVQTAAASVTRSKRGNAQPDEPKIEDPPLPGYDGDNGSGMQSMNSTGGKSRSRSGNNG